MFLARYRNILSVAAILVLGVALGWFGRVVAEPKASVYRGSILRQNGFKFIDPILACDVGTQDVFPEFKPIKEALTALVDKKIKAQEATNVSLYVRSLITGRWFEINPNITYAPASLLKVFVMMGFYKEAEENPWILEKRVTFEGSRNSSESIPGEVIPHLTTGNFYSIDELIRQMIVYSDNEALNTLIDAFDGKTVDAMKGIFSDLNIPSPLTQSESELNFMTVGSYSMAFRVLFGSTYLTREYSEKALELLTKTYYTDGIVAGVPKNISVAHKFGVKKVAPNALAGAELHDCGIVYYPDHPYLFCVMTRGSDFAKLQATIEDLSHTAYKLLDTFYSSLPSSVASSTLRL